MRSTNVDEFSGLVIRIDAQVQESGEEVPLQTCRALVDVVEDGGIEDIYARVYEAWTFDAGLFEEVDDAAIGA